MCFDRDGNEAFRIKADFAFWFSEGLSPVCVNSLWGYVDKTGSWMIEPQYEYASHFHDGVVWVSKGGNRMFINQKGLMEFDIPDELSEPRHHLLPRQETNLLGFMNVQFADGYFPIWWNEELNQTTTYGYMRRDGSILQTEQFDYAESFSEGLAAVMIHKKIEIEIHRE